MFPLQSRTYKAKQPAKYIHAIMVILALLLPLIPAVIGEVIGGYTITSFPPIVCTGSDTDATFYSLVLPLIIIIIIGTSILLFIFWIIHKVQQFMTLKSLFDYNIIANVNIIYRAHSILIP